MYLVDEIVVAFQVLQEYMILFLHFFPLEFENKCDQHLSQVLKEAKFWTKLKTNFKNIHFFQHWTKKKTSSE